MPFLFSFSSVGEVFLESTQIGLAPSYCYVAALLLVLVAVWVVLDGLVKRHPAFGVFFGFQVTDLDRFLGFFSLCHFIS